MAFQRVEVRKFLSGPDAGGEQGWAKRAQQKGGSLESPPQHRTVTSRFLFNFLRGPAMTMHCLLCTRILSASARGIRSRRKLGSSPVRCLHTEVLRRKDPYTGHRLYRRTRKFGNLARPLSLMLAQVTPTATSLHHYNSRPLSSARDATAALVRRPQDGQLSMPILGDLHTRWAVRWPWLASSRTSSQNGAKAENLKSAIAAGRKCETDATWAMLGDVAAHQLGLWKIHSRHVAAELRMDGREIFVSSPGFPRMFS